MYTDQRLNLSKLWEGPRKTCQGFKPDLGNPAVRDYRGASGNVSHGGNVHPPRDRKSGNGNPSPTAGRARFLSQSLSPIAYPWTTTKQAVGNAVYLAWEGHTPADSGVDPECPVR